MLRLKKMPQHVRQRLQRAVGLVITAVATVYFAVVLVSNVKSLPTIQWSSRVLAGGASAILLYTAGMVGSAYAWHLLLRSVGQTVTSARSIIIHTMATIGKYVPGNVGQYVGRAALARKYGLQLQPVVVTMVIETAWTALTAIVLGGSALVMFGSQFQLGPHINIWMFIGFGALILAVLFAGPLIVRRIPAAPVRQAVASGQFRMPPLVTLIGCFFIFSASFVVMGIVMTIISRYVFNTPIGPVWLIIGINAVAWVTGFITPGSPGGIGVREAVLVSVLGPLYGSGIAVGLSIGLRVVTVTSDGIAFAVALAASRFVRPAS